MNEVWNLDPLYKGFDDPAFDADMGKLRELAAQVCEFAAKLPQAEPLDGLREGVRLMEELTQLINKLAEYASLRQSADTRNTECGSKLGQVMQIASSCAGADAAFREWAAKLPDLEELLERDEVLREYRYFFHNIRLDASHLLGAKGEEIAARLGLSGGNAWADLQGYLTSTVKVSYRGEVTNLSAIRNMAYDPDPAVRKDAYEAEIACYEAIKDPVAHALNAIKLETISDCALRGFASPLDRTLEYSRMKRETLEAMLGAMDEYLPKFWQYLKAKGKALGHENGLPWYDLFAPMGSTDRKYTTQDAKDILVKLFSTFDQELADMVARAFDNAWIDFYPRNGKVGGAFCAGVEALGESRILTNFDGQFGDVVTLAHELGHAFHNQCIRDHRPLNRDYSMPVAETASTFNECVVMAAAIRDAQSDEEKLALIEGQLQDATQIICDIYSRFRFEAQVFENREARFMDADTLCSFMLEAQKQSYGDGLDENCLHPYMWVCKSHYYGPTFYNFPYAFGGLFARGLYARYQQEGADFVPKYKKLLYTTTIATAEDTAKVAGIDLTDKNFWRGALQTIADQIDLFCELVK
ncbi:MAG: M3 family oligoendopeptidase [Candidatus Faecousia sp.]|nr:M3 family oligoendopeptidase [Clostridiales bacterium]MDY6181201.1 M3 family oligoendopeptidase [Candidatus Faecousia sp.]